MNRNRIKLCGTVVKEPSHGIKTAREYLKFVLDTGCMMLPVPAAIREYKEKDHNASIVMLYDDKASEWWGVVEEGCTVAVDGYITGSKEGNICRIIPNEVTVQPDMPRENIAKLDGIIARDDHHAYLWLKDGKQVKTTDGLTAINEIGMDNIAAIEHPFLVMVNENTRIKVKAYDKLALRALEQEKGQLLSLEGPLHSWTWWSGKRLYDYAVLARKISYGGGKKK